MAAVEVDFPTTLALVADGTALAGLPVSFQTPYALILVTAGQGLWAFDPNSYAADDGTSVILPDNLTPLQAGRWILSFVIDQVNMADVTAAIAAATQVRSDLIQADAAAASAQISAATALAASTTPSFKIQQWASATTPPSGVASGDRYWVVDSTQSNLLLYLNTSGTGALDSPAVSAPLSPSLGALIDSLSTYTYAAGRPTTPTAGDSTTGAGTYLLVTPFGAATRLRRLRIRGGTAGGAVRIVRGTLTGGSLDTWTRTGYVDTTIVANSDNAIAIDITVGAGEVVGISAGANAFRYDSTQPSDSGGWRSTGQDVAGPVTTSGLATSQLQFGFDTLVQSVTSTSFQPPVAGPLVGTSYDVIHKVDALGVVQLNSIRHSDGLVAALTNGSVNAIASQIDSSDRVYFGTRAGAAQILERTMLASGAAGTDVPFVSTTDLVGWGDSLTAYVQDPANAYLPQLVTALGDGRSYTNGGVSGDTSTQIKTRMLAASSELKSRVTIIWAGRNNFASPTTVLSDIAAMVAALTAYRKRYIILSVLNGDTEYTGGSAATNYTAILSLNASLASAYPNNYIDIRSYLIANALTDNGLAATANDLIDIGHDVTPRQIRLSGDFLHGNQYMYFSVAKRLKNFIQSRGW